MDKREFWRLVEASRDDGRDFDQPKALQRLLEELPEKEIVEFDRIFSELHRSGYRWDLWGAAYIIGEGCGDDAFSDFRAALIGMGRETYDRALEDPETLSELPSKGVEFWQEALGSAAARAYKVVTGRDMQRRRHESSDEPIGKRWLEGDLPRLFPRISAKFRGES